MVLSEQCCMQGRCERRRGILNFVVKQVEIVHSRPSLMGTLGSMARRIRRSSKRGAAYILRRRKLKQTALDDFLLLVARNFQFGQTVLVQNFVICNHALL
jgi:hypothetical protein